MYYLLLLRIVMHYSDILLTEKSNELHITLTLRAVTSNILQIICSLQAIK